MRQGYSLNSNTKLLPAQNQKQKMSSAVIQGVKLLSLPHLAIKDYLMEATLSNPLLELNDAKEALELTPPDNEDEYGGEGRQSDGIDRFRPAVRRQDEGFGTDADSIFNMRGTQFELETLSGSLELQLSVCKLSPLENAIGREIIGNIDDRGYFVGNLDIICRFYNADPALGDAVLRVIQSFSPRGIAARNVAECLCLQIDDTFPHIEAAKKIIWEDLESLGDNRVKKCAKKYHLREDAVHDIFAGIRLLNPRPGNCNAEQGNVCYIIPDIVIKRQQDDYRVFISGETDNLLQVSREYLEMLNRKDLTAEESEYLHDKLCEAKMLIKSVSIRQQTLRKFALSLLKLQHCFFALGESYLEPLTMQKMAQEIGVNVSTVSRVVHGKYIDTPWGMYPLKSFFSGACTCQDEAPQGGISVHSIKCRMKAIIRDEDPAHPLNDTQICAFLSEMGYRISRRTVTKYRQALDLDNQTKRRR